MRVSVDDSTSVAEHVCVRINGSHHSRLAVLAL